MGYTYDIATSKRDKQSTISLTVCHLMFTIINLFLSTFLIAHIYSLTDNLYSYALNVGVYQLSNYICMFFAYFLFSLWVDRSNRVWVYRIANAILCVLVIVTIFYGKDLAKLVIIAGILNGIAHGGYYASYNVLKQEMVSRKSIKNFAVIIKVLTKVIKIVCPIILGALIDISTYSMVAIYVLILSAIQIFITFFIKSKKPENSNFSVKGFLNRLKEKPDLKKKVYNIYKISIFYGLVTAIGILLNISVMNNFGTNFSFGAVTSIFALVAIVSLLLMNKFTKFGKRTWLYVIVSTLLLTSVIIFSIIPNTVTLIIYHLCFSVCDVVVGTNYDIVRNKNLKEGGLYQDIAEHQFLVESIFQIVRIVTFTVLILVSLLKIYVVFQIYFVLLVVLYMLMPILLNKFEKEDKEDNK